MFTFIASSSPQLNGRQDFPKTGYMRDTKISIKWGGKSKKGEVLWGEWQIFEIEKRNFWKITENFNLLKYI